MRLALAMAALTAIVTFGARAAAQSSPPSVRLSWVRADGAEQCIGAEYLSHAVGSRLGRDPFGLRGTRSIEGIASREGSRWRARVYVRDEHGALVGMREIESDEASCAELGDAVALTIALAIDPDAAIRTVPAASESSASPTPSSSPPPSTASSSPPPRPSPRASRSPVVPSDGSSISLRGVVSAGLLPGLAPGFALGANVLGYGYFIAAASVVVYPEQSLDAGGGHFSFGLAAASLGACGRWIHTPRWVLMTCVNGYAGVFHTVVSVLQPTHPGDVPWGAFSGNVQSAIRLARPVWLEVGVEAVVPVYRPEFAIAGVQEPVFTQSPVAGVAHVGLRLQFR